MPIYMDRHLVEGVTAEAIADAHQQDLSIQGKHGVKFLTYWVDVERDTVFCLVDAPNKEAVSQAHRDSHGLIPNEVNEVDPMVVQAFLGRIEDPPPDESAATDKNVFEDPAFRAILFTDMKDSTAITTRLGDVKAMELLRKHNTIIRSALKEHDGNEVKHTGDGIMASFASVSDAVACAVSIQMAFDSRNTQQPNTPIHLRIGVNAGEPIEEDQDLFGSTVQLAARICAHARPDQILVSHIIHELCPGKDLLFMDQGKVALKGFEQPIQMYEVQWQASSA